MKIRFHMKNILYTAVKTLIGMKICLHTKNIYYTAGCKNINSYEDVLAYEMTFNTPL